MVVISVLLIYSPGLAGDLKKAMKDGKPIIIEVCTYYHSFKEFLLSLNLFVQYCCLRDRRRIAID